MKRTSAFTLVELLVAVAITSILATLLLGIVSATLNIWQQGRNQIDTFAGGRQVLGRIADEVKGAIASATPVVEFSENVASLAGTTSPVPGTSENVFFVAPYPNSGAGDLSVIAYRLNNDTHELQRGFMASQAAWNNGASNRYQSAGYTSAAFNWRIIAQGVLEFEVRSYSQYDMDGDVGPVQSWNSITGTDPNQSSDKTILGNVPRRVVLRLKVIDDKALARLNGVPANGPSYNRIIAQSARQFSADVTLLQPTPTPTPTPTPSP